MSDLLHDLQSALGSSYRLSRELGGGGMSRVFLADEVGLGRSVVIKVLPPEMGAAVSVERFRREIQMAARLQHPHIVPLLTAGSAGDLLYYVMPHVEGESLRARLMRDHELPLGDALKILRDVADALAYAHRQGIVHRDIKPDNVLLSGKHALVTDFGVAKAVSQSQATGASGLTSLGVALGTPAYMAPEQAAADPGTDHRADIYAAGALAYEMLTGQPPFIGPSPRAVLAAQMTATPDPLTKWRASVPPALEAVVMRCLAKLPADRWQSAEELHAQLEAVSTPATGTVTAAGYPPAAGERRHPLRIAGLFGIGGFALLGLVALLSRLVGLPRWVLPATAVLLIVEVPLVAAAALIERRRAAARLAGSTTPGGRHHWLTWRRALNAGVAAFALLGLIAVGHVALRALGIGPVGTLVASGALAERDKLVLADFENRTTDSTLGPSVTEALRIDLAQSPVVTLLDGAATAAALRRMSRDPATPLDAGLARELAQREGAKGVVRGEIGPVGRGYVLTAEVVAAADGSVLVAVRETARDDGAIIDAIDRLSGKLRERIGESLRTIQGRQRLEQVTTGSIEALQKYSQGVRVHDQGDVERAVTLLQEAVALDTTFAMAYRKLAVALANSEGGRSRSVAAATQAFRHRDRLPPLERHLTEAYYYSNVEYDRDRTIGAYRLALEADPEDRTALNNLALTLREARRPAEAESLALRGIALGAMPSLYLNAAAAQASQGDFTGARRTLDALALRYPSHPMLPFTAVGLAVAARRFDEAETPSRALARSSQPAAFRSLGESVQLALDEVRGRLTAAEQTASRAMALAETRGLPPGYVELAAELGLIEVRLRNRPARSLEIMEAALRRHPLSGMDPIDRPYTSLAFTYAEAGRPDRARALLREYAASVPEGLRRGQSGRLAAAAAVALAEGRPRDAVLPLEAWYAEDDCLACVHQLGRAWDAAGEADSALAAYERAVNSPGPMNPFEESTLLAQTYRRLGELYEARGDRAKARDYYGRFVDLWAGADQELQPAVRDARERIARLAAER